MRREGGKTRNTLLEKLPLVQRYTSRVSAQEASGACRSRDPVLARDQRRVRAPLECGAIVGARSSIDGRALPVDSTREAIHVEAAQLDAAMIAALEAIEVTFGGRCSAD